MTWLKLSSDPNEMRLGFHNKSNTNASRSLSEPVRKLSQDPNPGPIDPASAELPVCDRAQTHLPPPNTLSCIMTMNNPFGGRLVSCHTTLCVVWSATQVSGGTRKQKHHDHSDPFAHEVQHGRPKAQSPALLARLEREGSRYQLVVNST